MRILGIDPGKTVGYCVLETPITVVIRDQEHYKNLEDLRKLISTVDLIVMEDFTIAPDKLATGDKVYAAEVIGMIEAWSEGITNIKRHPPSKKHFVNDTMVKYLGVPLIAHRGHELDSVKHALYYSLVDLSNHAHEDVFPKMKAYLEEEENDDD